MLKRIKLKEVKYHALRKDRIGVDYLMNLWILFMNHHGVPDIPNNNQHHFPLKKR